MMRSDFISVLTGCRPLQAGIPSARPLKQDKEERQYRIIKVILVKTNVVVCRVSDIELNSHEIGLNIFPLTAFVADNIR
jgi:hypothetical protein